MSLHRHWRLRVQDIIEYASDLQAITKDLDYAAFSEQLVVQLAAIRCLEVIGEAARHVPPEVQLRCPEIAWRLMNDMRNVLIHAYPRVDLGAVWQAATQDVPPMRERLIRFLQEESGAES